MKCVWIDASVKVCKSVYLHMLSYVFLLPASLFLFAYTQAYMYLYMQVRTQTLNHTHTIFMSKHTYNLYPYTHTQTHRHTLDLYCKYLHMVFRIHCIFADTSSLTEIRLLIRSLMHSSYLCVWTWMVVLFFFLHICMYIWKQVCTYVIMCLCVHE